MTDAHEVHSAITSIATSLMDSKEPTVAALTVRALDGKVVLCNSKMDIYMTVGDAMLFADAIVRCVSLATRQGNGGK